MKTETICKTEHISGRDNISKFLNKAENSSVKKRLSERSIKTRDVKEITHYTQLFTDESKKVEKKTFWLKLFIYLDILLSVKSVVTLYMGDSTQI